TPRGPGGGPPVTPCPAIRSVHTLSSRALTPGPPSRPRIPGTPRPAWDKMRSNTFTSDGESLPMNDAVAAGRVLKPPAFERARLLRQCFRDVNYTEKGLLQVFGVVETPMPHLRNLPRLLDRTRTPTPLNTLIRWFLLGMPVDQERGRRSLPEEVLAICLESGLLAVRENRLVPAALLVPVGPYLVASDLYQKL